MLLVPLSIHKNSQLRIRLLFLNVVRSMCLANSNEPFVFLANSLSLAEFTTLSSGQMNGRPNERQTVWTSVCACSGSRCTCRCLLKRRTTIPESPSELSELLVGLSVFKPTFNYCPNHCFNYCFDYSPVYCSNYCLDYFSLLAWLLPELLHFNYHIETASRQRLSNGVLARKPAFVQK